MSNIDVAPAAAEPAIDSIPASGDETYSVRDAANKIADFRYKKEARAEREAQEPEGAEPAAEATPEDSPQGAADPAAEATGEPTETTAEPEELPPIEPPRSWTKEEKEEFRTYPREAQEKIARREQDREAALRRGQNETADERKAIAAEREKVEQARQQYEAALPALLQTLHQQQQGEFSDIKTMADVEKLAREDWPRYALWDAQQKKIAAVTQEVEASQKRQADEYRTKWTEFAAAEDAKFLERAPEMADKEKATKVADASVAMLKDVGFTEPELAKAWNGEASVSLRDHRLQLIIRDAARYRDSLANAAKKVAKPVPQVQRPGVAPARGEAKTVEIANLEKKLEQTGSWKDGAALIAARRQAGRR